MPGGTPSTMQPSASPCDSPKVVTRKSCPIVFPAITAPLLLCLRIYLIFINREMFSCSNKLLFGEHKHTITAVIKLQPGERNIRILFHKMYHAVADFTNQHAIISKVICRITENTTRQFQAVSTRCQTQFRLVTV